MIAEHISVGDILKQAQARIAEHSELTYSAPALEVRVLFEHVTGKGHAWQIAHAEESVSAEVFSQFQSVIEKRLCGLPIAFITGTQDFWSLSLLVDTCTLIPRQDTECLVEAALALDLPMDAKVIDLGTGTGAIALALAKEKPNWEIIGIDLIDEAVALAQKNALRNKLDVQFFQSNWLDAVCERTFHLIVSNPPYVESASAYLEQGDLRFEPASALSSGKDGLDDIKVIIEQAFDCLLPNAYLAIEHGNSQAEAIGRLFKAKGFVQITTKTDYNNQPRVTIGQKIERT